VNAPSPAFQDLLLGMSFSAIRFVAIKIISGSIVLRITTPGGALQLITVSDEIIISNPNPGSEITALAAQGIANVEMTVAGDS
jgi:hypothetical protein